MKEKGFIKYFVIIIIILVIVFLSQQAYSRGFGKTLISDATNQVNAYLAKGSDWALSTIYPKISGEVQKRGDIINNEINKEKEKVTQSVGEKIKNYFSGVGDAIFHPSSDISSSPPSNQNDSPPTSQNCNCNCSASPFK